MIGQSSHGLDEPLPSQIGFGAREQEDFADGAEGAGPRWEFAVSDNGIGIGPEYAERIFVIFQRLHTRDTYPGNGIGLALCKKIVEYHGGAISIDTAYEAGTRFRFTLPMVTTTTDDVIDAAGSAPAAALEGNRT